MNRSVLFLPEHSSRHHRHSEDCGRPLRQAVERRPWRQPEHHPRLHWCCQGCGQGHPRAERVRAKKRTINAASRDDALARSISEPSRVSLTSLNAIFHSKLTGMAFRVPTPNVSVVDLTVRLEKPVSDPLMRSDWDVKTITLANRLSVFLAAGQV